MLTRILYILEAFFFTLEAILPNQDEERLSPTHTVVPTSKGAISTVQDFVQSTIVLRKIQQEVGFTITGGSDTYLDVVCMSEVHQGGAAYQDGRLMKGDVILAVSSVQHQSHLRTHLSKLVALYYASEPFSYVSPCLFAPPATLNPALFESCDEMSMREVTCADAVRVIQDASSSVRLMILRENPQTLFTSSESKFETSLVMSVMNTRLGQPLNRSRITFADIPPRPGPSKFITVELRKSSVKDHLGFSFIQRT
ncbi:multiple PDZ domain protein-like [Tropilaelaps mercedesae]|uniref:Multiple PDZ domain protein-like n=1 Tax=Tropilaelaps mercedesae TaxID=418985 RepID=A0A1V9XF07_9ACAR|nr:multiple PDZ domain protein-like [Tropilaelaps mercedesae]